MYNSYLEYSDWSIIEKDFRKAVKNHDWQQYKGKFISIQCSNHAIIPDWAFMLISNSLKENKIENFKKRLKQKRFNIIRLNVPNLLHFHKIIIF